MHLAPGDGREVNVRNMGGHETWARWSNGKEGWVETKKDDSGRIEERNVFPISWREGEKPKEPEKEAYGQLFG